MRVFDMSRFSQVAFLATLLLIGCGKQSSPDAVRTDVQRLMEQHIGHKLNASSPLKLADVEGKLCVGMAIEEFNEFIAKSNKGPNESTMVMGGPFVEGEGDAIKVDPKKPMLTYFLRDADLIVVTELVGENDQPEARIVSWRVEPLRDK
jgi:hypothetical protein